MKLVFLGPPGAGKGTQAERFSGHYGIAHISTGDMLRNEMHNSTQLGLEAERYVDQGSLVPDDVIIRMVGKRIQMDDCVNGYLFDGFPRTVAQADALKAISDIDMVIYIDVDLGQLISRISGRRLCSGCGAGYHTTSYSKGICEKCGAVLFVRDDDAEETVRKRITVYLEKTQPLIDYYAGLGLLCSVNGNNPPDEVTAEVMAVLRSLR